MMLLCFDSDVKISMITEKQSSSLKKYVNRK